MNRRRRCGTAAVLMITAPCTLANIPVLHKIVIVIPKIKVTIVR